MVKGIWDTRRAVDSAVNTPSSEALRAMTGKNARAPSRTTTGSSFFFAQCGDHRDLHSFPTRRSSDLPDAAAVVARALGDAAAGEDRPQVDAGGRVASERAAEVQGGRTAREESRVNSRLGTVSELTGRSEEHTSELQSHVNLVCRLLLE